MKKKTILVAVVSVLLLVLAVSVVTAATQDCSTDPCSGGSGDDNLFEQNGDGTDDRIRGQAGRDFIDASEFTNDDDDLRGNAGNDVLNTVDGDVLDSAVGGDGRDMCLVDTGEEANADCEREEQR